MSLIIMFGALLIYGTLSLAIGYKIGQSIGYYEGRAEGYELGLNSCLGEWQDVEDYDVQG